MVFLKDLGNDHRRSDDPTTSAHLLFYLCIWIWANTIYVATGPSRLGSWLPFPCSRPWIIQRLQIILSRNMVAEQKLQGIHWSTEDHLSGGKYALLIHQTGDVWVHYTGSLRVCSTILVGLEVHTWQIPISCYLHLSSNSGQRNVKSGHISYLDKNHGWSVKARKDLQDLSCFCCQAWRAQLAQGLNVPKHRWCACGVNAVCEGLKDVDGHLQINHENLVRFLWGWIVMRKTVNEMVSPLLIDCLSIDMVIGIASSASQRYLVLSKRVPQNSQIGLFWLFWLLLNRLSNEVRKCGTIWSWKAESAGRHRTQKH